MLPCILLPPTKRKSLTSYRRLCSLRKGMETVLPYMVSTIVDKANSSSRCRNVPCNSDNKTQHCLPAPFPFQGPAKRVYIIISSWLGRNLQRYNNLSTSLEEMSHRQHNTDGPPLYDPSIDQNGSGGIHEQIEATPDVSVMVASCEGVHLRPPVEGDSPSVDSPCPPRLPMSPQPFPSPSSEPLHAQSRNRFPNPHAAAFSPHQQPQQLHGQAQHQFPTSLAQTFLPQPQPFSVENHVQNFQNNHYNLPVTFPYTFPTPTPGGYQSYQIGPFTAPQQYGPPPSMPHTQPWSATPQRNRENHRRRGRGRGRASYPNNIRQNTRRSSAVNTTYPANSFRGPPGTVVETHASGPVLSLQSPPVLIDTTTPAATTSTPQSNDRNSNDSPPQIQVSNPHRPPTPLNDVESSSTPRQGDDDTATAVFPRLANGHPFVGPFGIP